MTFLRCIGAAELIPLLYFALGFSLMMLGELIDQPHLMLYDRNWLFNHVWVSIGVGALVALVTAVLIAIDMAGQIQRNDGPLDRAYYPRLGGIRRSLSIRPSRLVLVSGLIGLTGYLVGTQLQVTLAGFGGGNVLPPPRFVTSGLALWGVFWLADCLGRPKFGTIIAAACFLGLSLLCLPLTYDQIIRE